MKDILHRGIKAYGYLAGFIFLVAGSVLPAVFLVRLMLSGFSHELLNLQYVLMLVKLLVTLTLALPALILLVIVTFLLVFKVFGIELNGK